MEGNSLGQDFRVHVEIQQTLQEEINNDHIVKREHLSGIDLRWVVFLMMCYVIVVVMCNM